MPEYDHNGKYSIRDSKQIHHEYQLRMSLQLLVDHAPGNVNSSNLRIQGRLINLII
jgi:hypothetical protein